MKPTALLPDAQDPGRKARPDVFAYVGQGRLTAGCKKVEVLKQAGLGLCLCPGELPPLWAPWFLDNGAYRAYRAGEPWGAEAFALALDEARLLPTPPDFVVAPDVVGGGLGSLTLSLEWLPRLTGFRVYLAVQDGMLLEDVTPVLDRFDGLFVGGTLEWKIQTGRSWIELAHQVGKKAHVGRIGIPKRVAWARASGADSLDSSAPLWSARKLEAWVSALDRPCRGQQRAWGEATASRQETLW